MAHVGDTWHVHGMHGMRNEGVTSFLYLAVMTSVQCCCSLLEKLVVKARGTPVAPGRLKESAKVYCAHFCRHMPACARFCRHVGVFLLVSKLEYF